MKWKLRTSHSILPTVICIVFITVVIKLANVVENPELQDIRIIKFTELLNIFRISPYYGFFAIMPNVYSSHKFANSQIRKYANSQMGELSFQHSICCYFKFIIINYIHNGIAEMTVKNQLEQTKSHDDSKKIHFKSRTKCRRQFIRI